jgi:hypothetical protein
MVGSGARQAATITPGGRGFEIAERGIADLRQKFQNDRRGWGGALMSSLEEPLLKLEHAGDHLKRLQGEMSAFMVSRPYAIAVIKSREDPVASLRLRIHAPLPPKISLLLGDFIQNLRASLDYLVFQLSLFSNPRLSHKQRIAPQFPILLKANAAVMARRLQFVPTDARQEIEALQPYRRGDRAAEDWLAVLQNLSNRDKHRQITPIGIRVRETFTPGGQNRGYIEQIVPFQNDAPISLVPIELVEQRGPGYQIRANFDVVIEGEGQAWDLPF